MIDVTPTIRIPLREIDFTFSRSSGPGGQNVNKRETKAQLSWNVAQSSSLPDDVRRRLLAAFPRRITTDGVLQISSQRFRDQGRNVADCIERLRDMLASVAAPPRRRRKTKPTKASRKRRVEDKRRRGQIKRLRSGEPD